MHSSHIRPARRGTNCKNIYHIYHCLAWVFWCALLPISVPFLLPFLTLEISVAEWTFSMAYCSLPSVRNWKYAAYRSTSHVPAVDDDAGKEDTAIRCGLTLDGVDDRQKGQTCKQTQWLQIITYDTITSAGLGWRKTSGNGKWHQILFQNQTKSTLRPFRIWIRFSKVKNRETLDASPKMGSLWLSGPVRRLSFLMLIPMNYIVQWWNMGSTVVCCDNCSYLNTLAGWNHLHCRGLKQVQAYTN